MEAATGERDQLKPFGQFLHEQGNGSLHDDLSHKLAELVEACVKTGKKGTLALTITVEPNDDEETLSVTDKIAVKIPEPGRKAGLFFHDNKGNLLRRDPRQAELPLREVPGGNDGDNARDLRKADAS